MDRKFIFGSLGFHRGTCENCQFYGVNGPNDLITACQTKFLSNLVSFPNCTQLGSFGIVVIWSLTESLIVTIKILHRGSLLALKTILGNVMLWRREPCYVMEEGTRAPGGNLRCRRKSHSWMPGLTQNWTRDLRGDWAPMFPLCHKWILIHEE